VANTTSPTVDNPLALQEQVCFALAVASRSVIALYKPVLEPMGLTHPKYLVMLALWEHEPLSARELARLLQLDPATLTPLHKRLEAIGYLTRARNPDDERALSVTLTAEGRALRSRALKVPEAVVARLGMEVAELRELQQRLGRVIAAASAPD
jgi:DNA-binding MarR family transcriptional regulator